MLFQLKKKIYFSDILEQAKPYNGNMEKYIIQNDKLDKWKYLKESKRIERKSSTGHTLKAAWLFLRI